MAEAECAKTRLFFSQTGVYTGGMNKRGATQTVFLGAFLADCQWAAARLSAFLRQQGLSVVQTFDLQTARSSHVFCDCPHHGQEHCTCQMIVLLAYAPDAASPLTLVLHGNDGRTRISLVQENPLTRAAAALADWVRQALAPASGRLSL